MNARTAANYLLYIMGESFDDLTNMKINKLLYYAQGHCLKKYGRPLFADSIEAWEHGPVVPEVYAAFKSFGDRPIREYDQAMTADVPPEEEELLYAVARTYGRYTAGALRRMTHVVGSPWDQTYREGRAHLVIPLSVMEEYFSGMEELKPAEKRFRESDFIGWRDGDGVLVLPKDWDDEAV